ENVLRMFRNRARAPPQHRVGLRRAIAAEDDDPLRRAGAAIGFPHRVEEARVHAGLCVAPPVAQEPVQLFQDFGIVMPVDAIGGVDRFARMRMIEIKRARIAIGGGGFGRGGREEKKRRADQAGSQNFGGNRTGFEEGFDHANRRTKRRADQVCNPITSTPSRAYWVRAEARFWQNKSPVLGCSDEAASALLGRRRL
ncbi:hypothetical protein GW17_00054043, partial [Ensete ventricosum]